GAVERDPEECPAHPVTDRGRAIQEPVAPLSDPSLWLPAVAERVDERVDDGEEPAIQRDGKHRAAPQEAAVDMVPANGGGAVDDSQGLGGVVLRLDQSQRKSSLAESGEREKDAVSSAIRCEPKDDPAPERADFRTRTAATELSRPIEVSVGRLHKAGRGI